MVGDCHIVDRSASLSTVVLWTFQQLLGAMLQLNLSLPPDPKAGLNWLMVFVVPFTVSQRDGVLW